MKAITPLTLLFAIFFIWIGIMVCFAYPAIQKRATMDARLLSFCEEEGYDFVGDYKSLETKNKRETFVVECYRYLSDTELGKKEFVAYIDW